MGSYLSELAWGTVRETTARTAKQGITSLMIMRAAVRTGGTRMASPASATATRISVLRWHSGTVAIRS
jgi:hypothetical protein